MAGQHTGPQLEEDRGREEAMEARSTAKGEGTQEKDQSEPDESRQRGTQEESNRGGMIRNKIEL